MLEDVRMRPCVSEGVLVHPSICLLVMDDFVRTVDSRTNGSAYNKNPSLTTFSFVPMELFLLFYES